MGDGRTRVAAVAALAIALVVFLASTGPTPELQASGPLRRTGGVCLTLEKWGLFGWREVGRTYSVADVQNGAWHTDHDQRQCAQIRNQTYLIRPPFDAPNGAYRICGLLDDEPCIEFEKIDFVSDGPGP